MKTRIILMMVLCQAVWLFGADSPLAVQRIESDLNPAGGKPELMFDGDKNTSVKLMPGKSVVALYKETVYLKSVDFQLARGISGKVDLKIGTSLDGVSWEWTQKQFNLTTPSDQLSVPLESHLASLMQVVLVSAPGTELDIAEISAFEEPAPELEITKVKVTSINDHKATFSWTTPIQTTGQVRYGVKSPDRVASALAFEKEHVFDVDGLLSGTEYQYDIIASDVKQRGIRSKRSSFRTTGITAPLFETVTWLSFGWDKADLSVILNIPANLVVILQPTGGGDSIALTGPAKIRRTNVLNLKGLKPGTEYRCSIVARSSSGGVITNSGRFLTLERNVALGCPVTGTFTQTNISDAFTLKGDVLSRITDGKFDYRTGMAVSGPPASEAQYFVIDLKKSWPIDKVKLAFRALCYPLDFSVLVSSNARTWKTIGQALSAADGFPSVSKSGDPMKVAVVPAQGIEARYVKFSMKKGAASFKKFNNYNFVQLFEAEVIPIEQ